MRLQEQRLWDTLRRHRPPCVTLERVENVLGVGMPDVLVRATGFSTWVELKAPNAPQRDSTRLMGTEGLRPEQINWHLVSARYELPTFVLIRDNRLRLWLLPGALADTMNDMTADELTEHSLAGMWRDVYAVLQGEQP